MLEGKLKTLFLKNKVAVVLLFSLYCIKAGAQSVGGTTTGTVSFCVNAPQPPLHNGFITLSGNVGTIVDWESTTDGGTTWISTGNTQPSQGYINPSQTICYRAKVKNGSSPVAYSSVSCITVFQPSVGGTITGGGTFCVGAGTLTLTANTGNVLNWQFSTNGGTTWTSVANTTATLTYSNITQTTIYEAVVQNSNLCAKDTSSKTSIIISPSVGGTITGGGGILCDSTGSGTLVLNGNVGKISWQSSVNGGTTWTALTNTTTALSYANSTKNIAYRAISNLGTCTPDTSNKVVFTINKTIAGVILNGDTTLNYNTSGTPLQLTGNIGNVIEWQSSTFNASTFTSIANTSLIENYGNLTEGLFYRVLVKNGTCETDTTAVVKINVLPKTISTPTNLFTPNGDGINDTWFIKGINNYDDNEVTVYTNYGNVVFSKKGYKNDWNGTYNNSELPDGTYYYVIKLTNPDKLIKGSVDILRGK